MNILMMAPQFPPIMGGVATRSYESAKSLAKMGEQVTVLTMAPKADSSRANHNGVNVISVKWLSKIVGLGIFGFMVKIIVFFLYGMYIVKARKVDLIYSTLIDVGLSSMIISKLFGTPYFLAIHGAEVTNPRGISKKWIQLVLRNASALTILANRQRVSLLKLGVSDEKICLIPEGIDIDKFNLTIRHQEIVSRFDLDGKKVILTVGRLIERKGHDMVIKSLPRVLDKVPEAIYLIVGIGAEEQNLRELGEGLGLEDKVIFAGFVPDEDVPKYYSASDVFIMPSREIGEKDIEGFGLVFLEANACGKPVIGGKSGGISDAVADGVSGILVDPLNVDEISQALITLLSNEELAVKLGSQGRKRVEEQFSDPATAEKFSEILGNVKLSKKSADR